MTDKEHLTSLVVSAQTGKKDAFEEIFRLTREHARKLAYSVVGAHHCEDVLQESYLLVYRKLRQLQKPEAFVGWLCRLVLHVAYRHKKKFPPNDELSDHLGDDDKTDSLVDALVLRRVLAGMHPRDRDVLVLRELLGLSYEDLSHTLQLPLGTVRSRLNTARKRLSERLTVGIRGNFP